MKDGGRRQRRPSILSHVKPLTAEDILSEDILVRQSLMNSLQLCPARVGFEINQPEEVIPVFGERPVFGTAVHDCAEHHVLDPKGQAKRIRPAEFGLMMERILEENYDGSSLDDIPEKEYKKFRREVIEAYRLWVMQVYEHFIKADVKERTAHVEVPLYLYLGEHLGRRIIAHGTPDLTIQGLRMEDNKTTFAAFKWTQEKADTEIQPSLYLAMHNIIYNDSITDFVYRIYDRKAEDWDSLHTARTEGEQEAILKVAFEYGKQIAANVFPPTPIVENYGKRQRGWYCSPKWCGAWNVCSFKGQINDKTDLTEVAVKSWS